MKKNKIALAVCAQIMLISVVYGQGLVRPSIADLQAGKAAANFEVVQAWTTDPFTAMTQPGTLEFGAGTIVVSADISVPRNVTLKFNVGSRLLINAGSTFRIYGEIDAPRSQIFAGNGAVVIGNKGTVVAPEWWGDISDDALDDTAALQAALDSAPVGGVVQLTAGVHIVSNLTIDRPVTFRGHNFGAQLKAKTGSVGYLINVIANSVLDGDGYLEGVRLTGFSLDGNMRTPDIGAIKMQTVEHFLVDHLNIEHFNREALNLYSNVREGSFEDLWFRYVGNADANYPAINLTESLTSTADAHNLLYFSRISSALTLGDHILIDTVKGKELNGRPVVTRDITFSSLTTHGIGAIYDGGYYRLTPAQRASGRIVVKAAGTIKFIDAAMRIAGIGQPFVHVLPGDHVVPPHKISFSHVDMAGRYAYTGNQVGIKVDAGDIHISNSNIDGPLKSIEAAPGSAVFMDTATQLFPATSILDVASNARMPVTVPMDVTVSKGLGIRDDQQESLYFRLHNTKTGGHSYNIAAGAARDGNSPGGFYVYDLTTSRLLFQITSESKMIVGRAISSGSVTLPYSATITVDANFGNFFKIAATSSTPFNLSNPTNATDGQVITFEIENASGGGLGSITWGPAFRLAGGLFTNPSPGKIRTISFQYNGKYFVELSRAMGDL